MLLRDVLDACFQFHSIALQELSDARVLSVVIILYCTLGIEDLFEGFSEFGEGEESKDYHVEHFSKEQDNTSYYEVSSKDGREQATHDQLEQKQPKCTVSMHCLPQIASRFKLRLIYKHEIVLVNHILEAKEQEAKAWYQGNRSTEYEYDCEYRDAKCEMVPQVEVIVILHFILQISPRTHEELLHGHVQVVGQVQDLDDISHEGALNDVLEEELRSLQEVLRKLQLDGVQVLVREVEQETADGCSLSYRYEHCVYHHEEELLEEVVAMSETLILNLLVVRSPVHQSRDEDEVKKHQN